MGDRTPPPSPSGNLRLLHCTLHNRGPVVVFDIVVEDEMGRRWITDHSAFRFDLEAIEE